MQQITLDQLPDPARVWVFGSERALGADEASMLLVGVDEFIDQWRAHGAPLTSARDWREDRFLTVAVDQTAAHASGCSIDGLYRLLRAVQDEMGSRLLGAGRVFFRDSPGGVACVSREEFSARAERGEVDTQTRVFDLSVTTLGEWRQRFESVAGDTWHRDLLPRSDALAR